MKTETFKSVSGSKVVIVDGIVTESAFIDAAPIGGKADIKWLKACGWKLDKPSAKIQFDGFGRKLYADGRIGRK